MQTVLVTGLVLHRRRWIFLAVAENTIIRPTHCACLRKDGQVELACVDRLNAMTTPETRSPISVLTGLDVKNKFADVRNVTTKRQTATC